MPVGLTKNPLDQCRLDGFRAREISEKPIYTYVYIYIYVYLYLSISLSLYIYIYIHTYLYDSGETLTFRLRCIHGSLNDSAI